MTIAVKIAKARASIELPEVRDVICKVAAYNPNPYIPHVRRPDIDFDALALDAVRMEENGHARWVARAVIGNYRAVPAAWQWVNKGVVADATWDRLVHPTLGRAIIRVACSPSRVIRCDQGLLRCD